MRTSANTRSRSIAPSCQASHRSSLTAIIFNHMKSCRRMITSSGGWHIFLTDDALSRLCQNCGGMEFGDLGARMDVDGAREGVFGLAVTRDGTKIIISDDDGNITVWSVETTKLSKNGLTQRAGQRLSSRGWSTHCGWCLGCPFTPWKGDRSTIPSRSDSTTEWGPDGKKLACGTHDDIRVYDVGTGALILGDHL